jgi:hypothetical protein
MHDMKRFLTVTMLAIVLTSTVSGCGTFRNWFCRGDHCDACASSGCSHGGSQWMPTVNPTNTQRPDYIGPVENLPRPG